MRGEKQLLCAAALLLGPLFLGAPFLGAPFLGAMFLGAMGCGDQVVIAHEVLAQDLSSAELDAGIDASAFSHEPSRGSGPLLHAPPKVPVTSHPDEHHSSSSTAGDSSVPDASHTAPKIDSHH